MRSILTEKSEQLGKELENLETGETAEEYLHKCAKLSIIAFVFAWLLWNLSFDSILGGLAFSLFCTGIAALLLASWPKRKLALRAKKIEKHLPFALMQLSVDLNSGTDFDKSLLRVSESGYGVLSTELGKAIASGKKSAQPTQRTLARLSERNPSRPLRRVVAQLVSVYEHGSGKAPGENVRSLALELLAKQKSASKEFSGKIIVFSLAFIAVSAIVPALFQAFNIVGSSFMETPLGPLEILTVTALVFPLINTAALLYIRAQTPEFLKG